MPDLTDSRHADDMGWLYPTTMAVPPFSSQQAPAWIVQASVDDKPQDVAAAE